MTESVHEVDKTTGSDAVLPAQDASTPPAVVPVKKYDRNNTIYTSGVNQPRDAKGKFRIVLARIQENLGVSGLQRALTRAEQLELMVNAGNYDQAAKSAGQLKELLDRLDSGALDATSLENVRESSRLLGQVLANLPLPFGDDTDKLRFTDLPPVLRDLIDEMTKRVEKKIGKDDAAKVTAKLKNFEEGGDVFSEREVSSELSTLLRLLT